MSHQASVSSSERRQQSRRPVALRAFAVPESGGIAEAQLSDLSYEGCSISGEVPAKRGERLELRVFRLGVIDAEVLWSDGGRAGCRFLG